MNKLKKYLYLTNDKINIQTIQMLLFDCVIFLFWIGAICFVLNILYTVTINNNTFSTATESCSCEPSSDDVIRVYPTESNNIYCRNDVDVEIDDSLLSVDRSSIYSVFKSILSLLGISNVVLASLITNGGKSKYGYILERLIYKNFTYKNWHIYIHLFAILIDYVYIEMNAFAASIFTTLGIILLFFNFFIIYYRCILNDASLKSFVIADIENRVSCINNQRQPEDSEYQELKYCGIGVMSYVADKINRNQTDHKKLAYKYIAEVLKLNINYSMPNYLNDFLNTDYFAFRQKDVVIILYEMISILFDEHTELSDSKVEMLDYIPELLSKTTDECTNTDKRENLNMAIALWLTFNVDYNMSDKILAHLIMNAKEETDEILKNNRNCIKSNKVKSEYMILLYYLYANVFFSILDSDKYSDSFRHLKIWLNNSIDAKSILEYISSIKVIKNKMNDYLLVYKSKLLTFCSESKALLFSTSVMTLNLKIKSMILKKSKSNIMMPMDEIIVHCNLFIKEIKK